MREDTHLARTSICLLSLIVLMAAYGAWPAGASAAAPAARPAAAESAAPAKRIALVIGNSRYESSPLMNPTHDADLIAKTLTGLGFDVRLTKDGSQAEMKRAIQSFGAALEKAGPDAVGLFYYAGHGLQTNGRNYLIPVGAQINRDADVDIEAVSADWVLDEMRYARNRLNFVILDACRNNPFTRSARSAEHGLARMDAPAGVLIAYSTAPGEVAADGSGANSPYSEALAHVMVDSDQPAELMFKQARDQVRRATSDRQTPWESSSLTGQNFYFGKGQASLSSGRVADAGLLKAGVAAPRAVAASQPATTAAAEPVESTKADFMADPLCERAVGEWRIKSDAMRGSVKLNADASAAAKIHDKSGTVAASWDCDADNRRLTITFDPKTAHKVVMDGAEKLLFGYDQAGVPVIYTR